MPKKAKPMWNKEFDEEAYKLSRIEFAAKFVSTIDPRGWPHITFIAFNRAIAKDKLVWGQFTEGLSKKNVKENPKQGIAMMTAEMPFKFIQIKAEYTHLSKEGEDLDYFSRMDLLRYNTYMNAHTAYYSDVIAASPVRALGLGGIVKGILANMVGIGALKDKNAEHKLPVLPFGLFNGPINPKFISWIDTDGFPVILPCFQLRAPDRGKLSFTLSQFSDELKKIPVGAHVSAFAMNMEMESIMVNGKLVEWRKDKIGIIEIDEIYNSMPPLAGLIYPKIDSRPKVTSFKL
ncbi:MAG: pyridoxamine 5'-phosphate oxidase family protein [Promethearchaeota archaeon]